MDQSQQIPPSDIARFSEAVNQAIAETTQSINQWNKYRSDYEDVENLLKELPEKVRWDVMVPITNVAFMPGQLIHTNEVLTLLGDNWFVEHTAKDAAQVVQRRIELVTENLQILETKLKSLKSKQDLTSHVVGEEGEMLNEEGLPFVDIREDLEPDDEGSDNLPVERGGQRVTGTMPLSNVERPISDEDQALLDRLSELEREEEEGADFADVVQDIVDSTAVDAVAETLIETVTEEGVKVESELSEDTEGGQKNSTAGQVRSPADIYNQMLKVSKMGSKSEQHRANEKIGKPKKEEKKVRFEGVGKEVYSANEQTNSIKAKDKEKTKEKVKPIVSSVVEKDIIEKDNDVEDEILIKEIKQAYHTQRQKLFSTVIQPKQIIADRDPEQSVVPGFGQPIMTDLDGKNWKELLNEMLIVPPVDASSAADAVDNEEHEHNQAFETVRAKVNKTEGTMDNSVLTEVQNSMVNMGPLDSNDAKNTTNANKQQDRQPNIEPNEATKPKKISKFKAARLQQQQQNPSSSSSALPPSTPLSSSSQPNSTGSSHRGNPIPIPSVPSVIAKPATQPISSLQGHPLGQQRDVVSGQIHSNSGSGSRSSSSSSSSSSINVLGGDSSSGNVESKGKKVSKFKMARLAAKGSGGSDCL